MDSTVLAGLKEGLRTMAILDRITDEPSAPFPLKRASLLPARHGNGPAVRVFLACGIPRGSHSLADYERGKRIVSRMAHGDPAAYQQFLKVLVKYVGV